MVKGIKANFKNQYKNDLNCEGCGVQVDYQSHVMVCKSYADLMDNLDLTNDGDLIAYSRKVLDMRDM